ncbi:HNH endonuclease [Zoogloea sp.]|uniref:HNH endonuclease n=1 Tax=Zoogloea sp. TaxID=49181 RepID=UPI0035AE15DE
MSESLPKNLPICNPRDRLFPIEWKESYFRRNINREQGGYVCPDCGKVFSGPSGFSQLEGDHITPYSRGGLTVWSNFTLRCRPCNGRKSNEI